jgi:hypothetical protein
MRYSLFRDVTQRGFVVSYRYCGTNQGFHLQCYLQTGRTSFPETPVTINPCCVTADSHIACRAHAIPLPCRAAKGLECVFPIWFTQCGRVWFPLDMPRPCQALIMPFFSRPRHSTTVERRHVGYLPAFGFQEDCYQKHTNPPHNDTYPRL